MTPTVARRAKMRPALGLGLLAAALLQAPGAHAYDVNRNLSIDA